MYINIFQIQITARGTSGRKNSGDGKKAEKRMDKNKMDQKMDKRQKQRGRNKKKARNMRGRWEGQR